MNTAAGCKDDPLHTFVLRYKTFLKKIITFKSKNRESAFKVLILFLTYTFNHPSHRKRRKFLLNRVMYYENKWKKYFKHFSLVIY